MPELIGATSRRSPRVCFLAETFPPTSGGQELHAYLLADRLVGKGLDLFVLTRQFEPQYLRREQAGRVPVLRFPPGGHLKGQGWRAVGRSAGVLGRAFWELATLLPRYDLVLVSGFRLLSIPALIVTKTGGKRCVLRLESPGELWEGFSVATWHGIAAASVLQVIRRFFLGLLRAIRNPLIRRADALIAISAQIEQQLLRLGVAPQRIRSIPNGTDTDKFRPVSAEQKRELRERLGLPPENAICIFTGRLATSKGLMTLIRAWADIVGRHSGLHLVLVGSGKHSIDDCEAELRDYIAARGLGSTTSLPGVVGNVHEYLQASDLFVFPTDYEGFSLALAEALACGLPALATRVGAAPELIEDRASGVLVPPKDGPALLEGFLWLLERRNQWETMGARARRSMETRYSFEAVAQAYADLFAELEAAR